MPIYEYHCNKCGTFEVTQRITESPLTICPTCQGEVHRLISRSSFVLKGSGWYATDYASSTAKNESPGSSTSDSSSDKTPAASTSAEKTTSGESAKSTTEKSTSDKTAA